MFPDSFYFSVQKIIWPAISLKVYTSLLVYELLHPGIIVLHPGSIMLT